MDAAILSLVVVAIAWGTVTFGAVYQWAYRPLLLMVLIAGLAGLWKGRQSTAFALTVAGLLVGGAIAVQLLPIDELTMTAASPAAPAVLRRLDFAYAAGDAAGIPVRHPLSIAPELTAIGLMFFLIAGIYVLGVARWLNRLRIRQLAAAITILGGVISLAAVIQSALSPSAIYGFWQPRFAALPFGPFVNKNHFAGWTLMAIPVAMGLAVGLAVRNPRSGLDARRRILALSEGEGPKILLTAFCAFVMMVGLLLSLSRSGIVSAALALIVAVLISSNKLNGWSRLSSVAVVAVAMLALMLAGTDAVANRFAALDEMSFSARQGIWRDTVRMSADFAWTGVGIRAFGVANLAYQTSMPQFHVGAAHSDWLQLVAEGGVLVITPVLFLLLAFGLEVWKRFGEHRRNRDFGTTYWIRLGAVIGIISISVQSLVEFSLQMPGNTMMFATICAMSIAPAPAIGSRSRQE